MACAGNKKMVPCPCTYVACKRRGKCCDCVANHAKVGEFPACFFSKDGEAKYDRSYEALKKDRG